MVGFLRLCQHFAKRKLVESEVPQDDASELLEPKRAKLEPKEELDEKKVSALGLKLEKLPLVKDLDAAGEATGEDWGEKPKVKCEVGKSDELCEEAAFPEDEVQVISQLIALEKLIVADAASEATSSSEDRAAQSLTDPWTEELEQAIIECDNASPDFVDMCFYKPLDLALDICDKVLGGESPSQSTLDEIDVTSLAPTPDLGQTQDPNVFLQSYFNPPSQNFFPFHKDLDQNESETEMNDNGARAQGDIPLIQLDDDEHDNVSSKNCGPEPTKSLALSPNTGRRDPKSVVPIRNYEISLAEYFQSNLSLEDNSGSVASHHPVNCFISQRTTIQSQECHQLYDTLSHSGELEANPSVGEECQDLLGANPRGFGAGEEEICLLGGGEDDEALFDYFNPVVGVDKRGCQILYYKYAGNQVTVGDVEDISEELVLDLRRKGKKKKKRKCKKRHCKKCKRRKLRLKRARREKQEVAQTNPTSTSSCSNDFALKSYSGISSATPSETSSTSGVADMSDGSGSERGRLPSPGVSSNGDLEMPESETSDYQRSTPSPRENPFLEQTSAIPSVKKELQQVEDHPKDLGFGDEIIKEEPSDSIQPFPSHHFTISTKSFYNCPSKPVVGGCFPKKIKSNKCLTVDLYKLPLISNDAVATKKKKKKKRLKMSPTVLDTLKNNKVKVSKHFKLTQDPKIMYQQPQVKIKRLPVSTNMIMSVSEDLLSRVSVSPKKKKHRKRKLESAEDAPEWFATVGPKKAKVAGHSEFLADRVLIRPPILNVTPTKEEPPEEPEVPEEVSDLPEPVASRFTSPASKSLSSSLKDPSNPVNPFLPLQKSSYLFGGTDDFEQNEEVIEYDEEETDDFSDPDTEANAAETERHGLKEDTSSEPTEEEEDETKAVIKTLKGSPIGDLDFLFGLKDDGSKCSASNGVATKIRFPAVQGPKNMIECKWNSCQKKFTTYGKLSDHLKACHVIAQVFEPEGSEGETYQCLWEGCKVYGKRSCSKSWLEKHVPTHGGKFAYTCIVSGCKMRFSSQKILQRHVNHHFAQNDNDISGSASGSQWKPMSRKSRKYADHNQSQSTKNLRRAGVKLKFRHTVFSARIFDFFDPGIMAGIKHQVYNLERIGSQRFNISGDAITFKSKILSVKHGFSHYKLDEHAPSRLALVRWSPENLLDDEWVPFSRIQARKTVKICHLPERAKVRLGQELFGFGRQRATACSISESASQASSSSSSSSTSSSSTSSPTGVPRGASRRKQYSRPRPFLL